MSKLQYESFMIYMIEGSTKIKAHHALFATTVKCLLDKIGNGQENQIVDVGRGFSSQQII